MILSAKVTIDPKSLLRPRKQNTNNSQIPKPVCKFLRN